jgi:hypothetical protein
MPPLTLNCSLMIVCCSPRSGSTLMIIVVGVITR